MSCPDDLCISFVYISSYNGSSCYFGRRLHSFIFYFGRLCLFSRHPLLPRSTQWPGVSLAYPGTTASLELAKQPMMFLLKELSFANEVASIGHSVMQCYACARAIP